MFDLNDETGIDHAQFRQYANTVANWMSPDPYNGSYDLSNPQSFNRYSYVLNNPLAMTDPSGLIANGDYCGSSCPNSGNGGDIISIIEAAGQAIVDLFGFGGPSFHGSLKPRPNAANPWPEYNPQYGPDIAGALGLPDEQCDFGVCEGGDIAFGLKPGSNSKYPFTFWHSIGELVDAYDFYTNLWQVGKFHANAHQVTYEDYCGPGGSGPNLSPEDAACHAHDVCYDNNGLHILDNFNPDLPSGKAAALQSCNQQLCNATKGSLIDKYFSGPGSPFGGGCK